MPKVDPETGNPTPDNPQDPEDERSDQTGANISDSNPQGSDAPTQDG
ncbi:MAG: hypothetical protein M3N68_13285 [Actinomycetota bacterium]|nr:hypothetical protein [Actinomycetota bacterium]